MADYTDEVIRKAQNTVANYNPNEQLNMNDSRLTNVENARQTEATQVNNNYNKMISDSEKFYQDQINLSKQYQDKQIENQNAQTEQTIKEIEQQRDKTQREYQKEQQGAYQDYQKQINPYGASAEQLAANGLANSGYGESSRVAMYNQYQQRVASAKQSLNDAEMQYNNMIAQARLTNNTNLADIAYNFAKTQADLALQGFQYKNSLLQAQEQQLNTINSRYDNRYNTVLSMLQNELETRRANYNAATEVLQNQRNFEYQREQDRLDRELKERQFEYQKERDRIADEQWQKSYNLKASKSSGSSGFSGYSVSLPTSGSADANANDKLYNEYIGYVEKIGNIYKNSNSMDNRNKAASVLESYNSAVQKLYNQGKISKNQAYSIYDKINQYR